MMRELSDLQVGEINLSTCNGRKKLLSVAITFFFFFWGGGGAFSIIR